MIKSDTKRPVVPPLVWIAAVLVVALVAAQFYGRGVFFLVLAGAVLLLAIGTFWSSIQALTGDAPLTLEEALSLAAPSTEEERKASVLRALKDLEYERSVGKINDEDYLELTRKYRQEAKRLLLLVDENLAPARTRAEALLRERLAMEPELEAAASGAPPHEAAAEPTEATPVATSEAAVSSEPAPALPVDQKESK